MKRKPKLREVNRVFREWHRVENFSTTAIVREIEEQLTLEMNRLNLRKIQRFLRYHFKVESLNELKPRQYKKAMRLVKERIREQLK